MTCVEKATGSAAEIVVTAESEQLARGDVEGRGFEVIGVELVPEGKVLDYQVSRPAYWVKSRWKWVAAFLALELSAGTTWFSFAAGDSFWADAPKFGLGALIILLLQLGMMAPVLRPRQSAGPGKPAVLWMAAAMLGLLLGSLVFCLLVMGADFLWTLGISDEAHNAVATGGAILAVNSWLVSIPLIVMFMRRSRSESFLAKFAAALFLGSVVEFIAAIPLLEMVKRKHDCECDTYTFWSMIITCTAGFIVLGPMILLVIFTRRSRAATQGLCAACGYDLRGAMNKDRCPQCGAGWKVITDAGGG